jgi:protein-disulfide isomerase
MRILKGDIMRSNARRLALWIALTLLAAVPAWAADIRYSVPAGDSPTVGPANAPVTIVEFLDYQ